VHRETDDHASEQTRAIMGHYGNVRLDGLNLLALGAFEGNLWMEDVKARMGFFIDERADAQQREALQTRGRPEDGRPVSPVRSARPGALNSFRSLLKLQTI
jgi:hypothetical protein